MAHNKPLDRDKDKIACEKAQPVAFGFRESFKLAPGVRMTLSKRGASVSSGPKGTS